MPVGIRQPWEIAEEALAYEIEADGVMEDFDDRSPLYLAQEMLARADVYDGGAALARATAAVLRGRQSEWLKGRRWPAKAPLPGRQELERTSDYAQAAPDIDDGVLTRET